VPAGHGVRSDQIEALFPVGPELAKGNPEQFVEQTQSRLRMLAFQDDELPAKREVLQYQVLARTKKAKDSSEPDPEKVKHSGKVIAVRILIRAFRSLISQSDGIVARDRPRLMGLWWTWRDSNPRPHDCQATLVRVSR